MNVPPVKEGMAILYPGTGPTKDAARSHICIVVTEADHHGDMLLVPICSQHKRCDATCLITPKDGWDHIKKDSFAAYYSIKRVTKANIEKHLNSGYVTYLGQVPPALMVKVKSGVELSSETEQKYLNFVHALKPKK